MEISARSAIQRLDSAPAATPPAALAGGSSQEKDKKPRRGGKGPFDCIGSGKLIIAVGAVLSLLYVLNNSPFAGSLRGHMDTVRCVRGDQE